MANGYGACVPTTPKVPAIAEPVLAHRVRRLQGIHLLGLGLPYKVYSNLGSLRHCSGDGISVRQLLTSQIMWKWTLVDRGFTCRTDKWPVWTNVDLPCLLPPLPTEQSLLHLLVFFFFFDQFIFLPAQQMTITKSPHYFHPKQQQVYEVQGQII